MSNFFPRNEAAHSRYKPHAIVLSAALLCTSVVPSELFAQITAPEVVSWVLNTTNAKGYGGISSNVQQVQYSADNVYVSCTCIPGYDIGPWAGNPNMPANQNFVFKLTRSPKVNDGTKIATPNGHIGIWRNGVSIFNAKDARSYNNQGIWNQNAIIVEGAAFDDCLGHPAPNGEYHHHLNPICLYDSKNSAEHSPIIGYAFDGFPVYGAFGFANADGTGGVKRMQSSYRTRNITARTTKSDGTALTQNQYGPAIGQQYPLGYYIEDFEYAASSGDLDEHNGRFAVTPDYPQGTYAYFVTIDEQGTAAYPYTLGPTYKGLVPAGNTGPQSGHAVPSESVTTYTPEAKGVEQSPTITLQLYPNPVRSTLRIIGQESASEVHIIDATGKTILHSKVSGQELNVSELPSGAYTLLLFNAGKIAGNGAFVKE